MVVVTQVVEKVSAGDLYKLINEGTLSQDNTNMLRSIHKNILKDGQHIAKYHFADNQEENTKRLTAKGAALQFLPSNARNFLMHKKYKELDVSNCATTILLNIMEHNEDNFTQEEMEFISKYHANKKVWMEKSCDADKFKKRYLTVLFANSNYSTHISEDEWYLFKIIRQKIVSLKNYKHIPEQKIENCLGKKLAHIIFEHEKNIMLSIKDYCAFNEIETSTIIFDAIYVDKNAEIDFDDMQEHIKNETNFDIQVKIKEVEEPDESLLFKEDSESGEVENNEENIHDKIYNQFMVWAHENNLIRIKNTTLVMKKHLIEEGINYAAKVMYTNFKDTIFAFQNHVIEKDLFTGKFYEAKYKNLKSVLDTESPSLFFPIVETDWRYFGYTDGVLNITTNEFIKKEDFKEDILVRKFLGIKYSITEFSDSFMKILTDQQFTEETINCLYVLMGRLFYPIGALDNERYVLALIGATTSGKSTILEGVLSVIDSSKRCTIDTSGSTDNFMLGGKNNKELLSCSEATSFIKKIGEENFKSMSAGEEVEINEKFKPKVTEKWTTPIVLCANDSLVVRDKSGAINGKRIMNFTCRYTIQKADPNIIKNVKETFKNSVGFLIDYYYKNKNNISECISEQLHEWNKEVEEEDNHFRQLMEIHEDDAYYQIRYKKGSNITTKDLKDAWSKHWKFGLGFTTPVPKIGRHEQNYLRTLGIEFCKINFCQTCLNKFTKKDCTCTGENFLRHKTSKEIYKNAILIPGKRNPDYVGNGEDYVEVG